MKLYPLAHEHWPKEYQRIAAQISLNGYSATKCVELFKTCPEIEGYYLTLEYQDSCDWYLEVLTIDESKSVDYPWNDSAHG